MKKKTKKMWIARTEINIIKDLMKKGKSGAIYLDLKKTSFGDYSIDLSKLIKRNGGVKK